MAIPVSTVPLAKLAVYNATLAQVNDPSVTVSYDDPSPGQLTDDVIAVGDVERKITPFAMVASGQAGWLDEEYSLSIIVSVYRGGDDARTAFERACVLVDFVVAGVRADPSLGGVVVVAHPEDVSYDAQWEDDHKGRLVTATVRVRCRARI